MVHSTFQTFVESHRNQLECSGIPNHFWLPLYKKITGLVFDAGNVFSLLQIDYEDEERGDFDPVWQLQIKAEPGIKHTDSQHIYLVDHAWTFRIEHVKNQLLETPSLRERMATIMGFDSETEKNVLVDSIFNEIWRYCNTYSIGSAENIEDRMPVWYIMDEVGSAIQHSNNSNFKMVPFIHVKDQMTYSLIFPVKDLKFGEVVSRDFAEGVYDKLERRALLLPWADDSLLDVSFEHKRQGPDYFLSSHVKETLPVLSNFKECLPRKSEYKVFSQYDLIREFLTDSNFKIVDNEDDADILWYTQHFKAFQELSSTPEKFVNQFPFEYVLTIKDLLCLTCRRSLFPNTYLETSPPWLPVTYNLKSEIPNFVSYYQHREKNGLDNHWIIKPFNLARGLDTHITKNLQYIMRLPLTGPKIAQKYIENPVLFYRPEVPGKVKFDMRYVILLQNVKPLKVYAYKNFFLRFANKPFELNNFDEYEKHFTVMNYTENSYLKHMLCSEFRTNWEQQYPNISWDSIENSIFQMLKEIYKCAMIEKPPCGMSESPQSRALYAADIMLEWNTSGEVQPKILEINWMPDCKRACDYYKNFYNDIFKLLFLGEVNVEVFEEL